VCVWGGTHSTLPTPPFPAPCQVRRRSDRAWVDVAPPTGVLVCNVADCLMRWTNDTYVSTPHRVILQAGAGERFSAAFFLGSTPDTRVECLASCCSAERPPRYPPTTAGEHLAQRLAATYPHLRGDSEGDAQPAALTGDGTAPM
jgi:isopenicillin N synthase-like dioxygenase